MTWAKLDDGWPFHRKTLRAGNEACGAWARMLAHSSDQGTDGFVDDAAALLIALRQEVLDRLMEVRFLERVEGGYVIHDFLDCNPSAAEVKAEKELRKRQRSDAGRASAAKRAGQRTPNGPFNGSFNGSLNEPLNESLGGSLTPRSNERATPSRPVPSRDLDPPAALSAFEPVARGGAAGAGDSIEDWGIGDKNESPAPGGSYDASLTSQATPAAEASRSRAGGPVPLPTDASALPTGDALVDVLAGCPIMRAEKINPRSVAEKLRSHAMNTGASDKRLVEAARYAIDALSIARLSAPTATGSPAFIVRTVRRVSSPGVLEAEKSKMERKPTPTMSRDDAAYAEALAIRERAKRNGQL